MPRGNKLSTSRLPAKSINTTHRTTAHGRMHTDEDLYQFIASLLYDIHNPLNNISLAAEMVGLDLVSDEQRSYLDVIIRNSKRIDCLVDVLLMHRQTDKALREPYSIKLLLDEVIEQAQGRLALMNIPIIKNYDKDDCIVLLNKEKMKIALSNIITNAVEAMPLNGGELKLIIRASPGMCIVRIEDNGCGISDANLKAIFDPAFTGNTGGLGIGLTATSLLLQSEQIGLKVESTEGVGTHFILLFNTANRKV